MKTRIVLVITIVSIIVTISCQQTGRINRSLILSELSNPHEIVSDESHLIISDGIEGTTIYVYDIESFELISKFGGTGDTTGKFIVSGGHEVDIDVRNDTILISSHWKTSFFTKNGDLISEHPVKYDTYNYGFLKNNYYGQDDTTENNIMYYTFNLHDDKFNKVKEIARIKGSTQNGITEVLVRKYQGITHKGKLYLKGGSEEFEIEVFDENGNHEKTIRQKYSRLPVKQEHKDDIYKMYREHPLFGRFFEAIKDKIKFPGYLPSIQSISISGDNLYAVTYQTDEGGTEILKMDTEGNKLGKYRVPLKWKGATEVYPYTISDNWLYQLARNKTGEWVLLVSRV